MIKATMITCLLAGILTLCVDATAQTQWPRRKQKPDEHDHSSHSASQASDPAKDPAGDHVHDHSDHSDHSDHQRA